MSLPEGDGFGKELPGQTIEHSGRDQTAPTGTAPAGTNNINACFIDATTLPTGTPSFDAIAAASGYTNNCGESVTASLTGTLIDGDDCE